MGLLDGKNIVITGVLTDASLAFGVAKIAQEQGANVVLTGAGRALRLTQRTARKLGANTDGSEIEVFELDVTVPEHGIAVREGARGEMGPSRRCASRSGFRSRIVPRRQLHGCAVG